MKREISGKRNALDGGPSGRKNNGSAYSADKLMRSALKLFSKRDFKTVTIKDIAAETGVNPALIYYYYKNKEDLFRAAMEFAINKALERYSKLRENDAKPDVTIDEWFRNNLEMVALMRQLVKVSLDYANSGARIKSVDTLIEQFYRMEESEILAQSIRLGIEQGIFKNCDPGAVARFVSVHLDGIMVASIIRPIDVARSLQDLRTLLFSYLTSPSGSIGLTVKAIHLTQAGAT